MMMPISRDLSTQTTYILCCWQEGSNWRYSLKEVGENERQGFATLDEFVAFLLARSESPEKEMRTRGGNWIRSKVR